MRKNFLLVGVYGILLINIALGFFMFFHTQELIMSIIRILKTTGIMSHAVMRNIDTFVSGIVFIIIACLAVISVPLLEHHYGVKNDERVLVLRILRVMGIQLIYLGVIQLLLLVLAGILILDAQSILFILLGGAFIGIRWWIQRQPISKNYPQQIARHA